MDVAVIETVIEPETELRKLPYYLKRRLTQLLDLREDWKLLMSIIPSTKESTALKYNIEYVQLIEEASRRTGRSPSDILLDEWGTSGCKRPTIQTLLALLTKAQLFRAAEFISTDILKGDLPERPSEGPTARVDVSTAAIQKAKEQQNSASCVLSLTTDSSINTTTTLLTDTSTIALSTERTITWPFAIDLTSSLPRVEYSNLKKITDDFCDIPVKKSGRKLGSGAFGTVYLGILPSGTRVAIKRLHSNDMQYEKQFRNEVEMLSKYQHSNIVPLLGFSYCNQDSCLIYAFMSNGSLQDRLECMDGTPAIGWAQRLKICMGTARGIGHLHYMQDKPLVHRDIKSANVLLDDYLIPRIGDFGLARIGASGGQSVAMTTNAFGTSAYMAPEAFRGDVSVKLDIFSFGVVILELLTGLPPYDENREGCDLVTHIDEKCDDGNILPLVDQKAGEWPPQVLAFLYTLSKQCLEEKKLRPTMVYILKELEGFNLYEEDV